MTYLKRLLAMFLGITALPARAIYHGFEFGVVSLIIGATVLLGAPVLAAYLLHRMGAAWPLNFLLTALAIPATAVVVALGLAVAAFYIVYTTVVDVFKMAWLGLKSGFVDGLDGFRRTWNNQSSPVERISNYVRGYYNGVSVANQINNEDDFNALHMSIDPINSVDVQRPSPEVSNLQSSLLHHSDLLTEEEIKAAEQLLKDVSTIGIPLSPDLKGKVELLSVRKTNYQDLLSQMESVKDALLNHNPSVIDDELMSMDIAIPIVLIKQYQTPDNVWHSVPANSYVTDKQNMITWLREKSTHPLNNDVLRSPSLHEGMPTRYRWDVLTAENSLSVPELHESATIIRGLLSTLPAQLIAAKQNPSSPGSTPQALFGVHPLSYSQTASDEHIPDLMVSYK